MVFKMHQVLFAGTSGAINGFPVQFCFASVNLSTTILYHDYSQLCFCLGHKHFPANQASSRLIIQDSFQIISAPMVCKEPYIQAHPRRKYSRLVILRSRLDGIFAIRSDVLVPEILHAIQWYKSPDTSKLQPLVLFNQKVFRIKKKLVTAISL